MQPGSTNQSTYYWDREGNQLFGFGGGTVESLAKYDGALALDPRYKDALYRKGIALMAVRKAQQAIGLFDSYLAADPKNKYVYNAKGLDLEEQGKYAEAIVAYNQALQIDPSYGQAPHSKMHALLALKKPMEAMEIGFLRRLQ